MQIKTATLQNVFRILLVFVVVFVLIQFIKVEKNESSDLSYEISNNYPVSNELSQLLKVSCYDCHSNNTNYPWYSKIQPVAWWLDHHVQDGKKHLNFSYGCLAPNFCTINFSFL